MIEDVEPEDAGVYVCIATNGFGSQRAAIQLIVTGKGEKNESAIFVFLNIYFPAIACDAKRLPFATSGRSSNRVNNRRRY